MRYNFRVLTHVYVHHYNAQPNLARIGNAQLIRLTAPASDSFLTAWTVGTPDAPAIESPMAVDLPGELHFSSPQLPTPTGVRAAGRRGCWAACTRAAHSAQLLGEAEGGFVCGARGGAHMTT